MYEKFVQFDTSQLSKGLIFNKNKQSLNIYDKFFTFLRAADEYCISRNGGNVPYLADNDAFAAEETPANHQYNMLRSIGWINSVFYNLQTFTRRRTQSDSFHLIHKDQGTARNTKIYADEHIPVYPLRTKYPVRSSRALKAQGAADRAGGNGYLCVRRGVSVFLFTRTL